MPDDKPEPARTGRLTDRGHPFYKPLWRRIALVAFTGTWAAVELIYLQSGLFSALFLGLFAYAVWVFLLTWDDKA
jgi:hypothetical protein